MNAPRPVPPVALVLYGASDLGRDALSVVHALPGVRLPYHAISGVTERPCTTTEAATVASVSPASRSAASPSSPRRSAYAR